MERQRETPLNSRSSPERSATLQNLSANASVDANNQKVGNADNDFLSAGNKSGDPRIAETINFETQDDVYTWPFQLCRSYEMIKPLIEEIYTLKHEEYHVGEVREGRYDIRTNHGAVILPTVWTSLVQPFTTIRISFWNERPPVPRSSGNNEGLRRHRRISYEDVVDVHEDAYSRRQKSGEYDDMVTIDVDVPIYSPPPPVPREAEEVGTQSRGSGHNDIQDDRPERGSIPSEGTDSETDSESTNSTETEEDVEEVIEFREPSREVNPPIDADGNKLSFTVDTTRVGHGSRVRNELESKVDESKLHTGLRGAFEGHYKTFNITKALQVQADTKTLILVHTLPGPTTSQLRESATMTWHHIQAEQLDFLQFKQTCLGIPNISDRLRMLIRELLAKIEKHRIKAFQDGWFIEPGTVLRADEKGQLDPQTAIFSCIPYFDLQPLAKTTSKTRTGDRRCPPRTLMQSYYAYEDVRERDSEQAYKKFGDVQSNRLIYVPNMWMINISTNTVITCGHKPLAEEMIKSIAIVQEDMRELGTTDIKKANLTNIRLTDWDRRVHLYQLDACRSYFQMEQKLRDLRACVRDRMTSKSLLVAWDTSGERTVVTPKSWSAIIKRTDLIFIDLVVLDEQQAREFRAKPGTQDVDPSWFVATVPPFFHWPFATGKEDTQIRNDPQGINLFDTSYALQCLELTEKAMLSETLDSYNTTNEVDESFTSTAFYKSLPEDTHDHVSACFKNLTCSMHQTSTHSYHVNLIVSQRTSIVEKATRLWDIIQNTMRLFVSNTEVDSSIILQKVWGAMGRVHSFVADVQTRGAADLGSYGSTDSNARVPRTSTAGWYIRDGKQRPSPLVDADKNFKHSLRHCRQCQSRDAFDTSEAAIDHLRNHSESRLGTKQAPPGVRQVVPSSMTIELNYDDWVVQATQLRLEETNAGALKILTQSCEDALQLFQQITELSDGVRNEDGELSGLYKLPRKLHEAFRQLIVFYLAIERALHYTNMRCQKLLNERYDQSDDPPYSERGLEVLKRFARGAQQSVTLARQELCSMVMPATLPDIMQGLSLSPEYVCGWLMRRLLVKPLEGQMAIGDMYREYLSKIQFQVNHRPGKRLIRSINLIQEELQVITEVNTWQNKLINNYMCVLDDKTYDQDRPSRRAMFNFERELLESCRDNLALSREEYVLLFSRCGPLSDRTKQSLEINEEDHGKAIMVFTIVTIIFLPLSFVTSFLGMNTVDIRDMNSGQSLFWAIAVPLTLVTMGSTMLIGYNGDGLRDTIVSAYRTAIGKQDRSTSAHKSSVAQRKRAQKLQSDSNISINDTSSTAEAEYTNPRPEYYKEDRSWVRAQGQRDPFEADPTLPTYETAVDVPLPRTSLRPQAVSYAKFTTFSTPQPRAAQLPVPMRVVETSRYVPANRNTTRLYRNADERDDYDDPQYGPRRNIRRPDELITDDGVVQEYVWHKKHKRRPTGGVRTSGYIRRSADDQLPDRERTRTRDEAYRPSRIEVERQRDIFR